jgi:adenylate cyclase ExoY
MKSNLSIHLPSLYNTTDLKKKTVTNKTSSEKIAPNQKKHSKKILVDENVKNQDTKPQVTKEIKIDNLFKENNIGIPAKHAIKMQQIAKKSNTIFGIRPVESIARTLINEGYPTKNFKVKGKSSNWGPQSGFICKNQYFSKKNGSAKDIEKFNTDIEQGITKGHFKTTALKISKGRIEELRDELHLIETTKQDNNILIYAMSPSGKEETFIASYNQVDDMYELFNAKDNTPIEVVCDLKLGKPLTADYDLLLVAPRIENFNNEAKDSRQGKMSVFKNKYIPQKDKVKHIMENVNKSFGNSTKRSIDLIEQINNKLNRGYGLEVAHHSDDAGNPNSNMHDNFPATFFLPKKIGEFNAVTVIKDKKMFDEFIVAVKDAGFHFEDHPLWDVPRRPSYEEALNFFQNKC